MVRPWNRRSSRSSNGPACPGSDFWFGAVAASLAGAAGIAGADRVTGTLLRAGQDVTELLHLEPQLVQWNDAGAMLLIPEKDAFPEDIDCNDPFSPHRCSDGLSFLGESLSSSHIEVMLVLEAAQQAPASAGDLRGIEGEMLVLRQTKIDGRELLEPGG